MIRNIGPEWDKNADEINYGDKPNCLFSVKMNIYTINPINTKVTVP